jgi:Fe2+ or Zn2+ uptake regulation protein
MNGGVAELERLKVVDRTRPGHGPATYHLAAGAHGHLICENCGSMTEVPDEMFSSLAETARERYGFTVEPHRSAVTGMCQLPCQTDALSGVRPVAEIGTAPILAGFSATDMHGST